MIEQDISTNDAAVAQEDNLRFAIVGEQSEVTLIDLLTQLAYRKWLIAKVTGVALLVGVLFALMQPVRYEANTKLLPPHPSPSSASMMMSQLGNSGVGTLAAVAGGLGLRDPNDTYIGLLASRPVADAIIRKFSLGKVYHSQNMTDARGKLAGNTKIETDKQGFILITVTDGDKKRVAEIANAYAEELGELTNTLAVTEASQRRLFYQEQLKQAKNSLVAAEFAFKGVQQKKGLVQLDAQAKMMIDSLAALRAKVAAKEVEVQALRSYSTEHNPDVQLAERELSSLQGEVAQLELRSTTPGFSEIGLSDVPAAGLEYLRAEHELRYQQALFDLLLKQYDAARLDEAKNAAIIQVVEPAIEPDNKSPQRRALIALLFSFLGFFAGCLLAFLQRAREIAQSNPQLARKLQALTAAFMGREARSRERTVS